MAYRDTRQGDDTVDEFLDAVGKQDIELYVRGWDDTEMMVFLDYDRRHHAVTIVTRHQNNMREASEGRYSQGSWSKET